MMLISHLLTVLSVFSVIGTCFGSFRNEFDSQRNSKNLDQNLDRLLTSVADKVLENETSTIGGCVESGSMFAEGSAMASPDDCSFCYCIRGERRCVTPKCKLPLRGCKPRYRSVSCCPTFYDCPKNNETAVTTSTSTTTTNRPESESVKAGCSIGGRKYFEGQFIPGVGGECRVCHCLRGRQQCSEIKCKPPVKGCKPVLREGQCCPIRYECGEAVAEIKNSESKLPNSFDFSRAITNSKVNIDDIEFSSLLTSSEVDLGIMANQVRTKRQTENKPVEEPGEITITTEYSLNEAIEETTVLNQSILETESVMKPTEVMEDLPITEENPTDISLDEKSADPEGPTVEPEPEPESEPEPEPELASETEKKENMNKAVSNKNIAESTDNDFGPPKTESITLKDETLHRKTLLSEEPSGNQTPVTDNIAVENTVMEKTTPIPFMSITDLLKKIKESSLKNKESVSEILPAPIETTQEEIESPDIIDVVPEDSDKNVSNFPSYDINVRTSMIAGKPIRVPIGVGHVIPVDLHEFDHMPPKISQPPPSPPPPPIPSTTTKAPKSQPSFLDTFLNLLAGSTSNTRPKVKEAPDTFRPTPPPIKHRPPFLGMKAPPPRKPQPISNNVVDKNDFMTNENVDAPISIHSDSLNVNSFATESKFQPPFDESPTRNELPIRRRPDINTRPSKPGLFDIRPDFLLPRPISHNKNSVSVSHSVNLELIDPVESKVGGNLLVDKTENTNINTIEKQTLPPSLPNLQIIPFVAADAVVNQEKDAGEEASKPATTRPIGNCREGGKTWKNGETVARGDSDPCVLCRCHFSKVVCQHLECPAIPVGCTAEGPEEGECCKKIVCDKSSNVSIIDTLPKFTPINDEENSDKISKPVRPSAFAHHNRRPPFVPGGRRPKPGKPLSELRKSFISQPKRPIVIPSSRTEVKESEAKKPTEKVVRRPVRPTLSRPLIPLIPKPEKPFISNSENVHRPFSQFKTESDRPQPFSNVRTGTRRPFIPPRTRLTTRRFITESTTKLTPIVTTTEISETTTIIHKTENVPISVDTSIPVVGTVTFAKDESSKPPKTRPFKNLFELLSKSQHSIPNPIHKDPKPAKEEIRLDDDKPFILPPDLLLPRPLPPSGIQIDDDDIINLVQQGKIDDPENEPLPEVVFNIQTPNTVVRPFKPTARPLPAIPEFVKAQLPLGNDPILVSGLLELGGCNVYGRMFDIGERIKDISGKCKVCQCTKVGVQCLPIC